MPAAAPPLTAAPAAIAVPAIPPPAAAPETKTSRNFRDFESGEQGGEQRQDKADEPNDGIEQSCSCGGGTAQGSNDLFGVEVGLVAVPDRHDELHHDPEDGGGNGCVERVGDHHAKPAPEQKAKWAEDHPGDEQRAEQCEDRNGDLSEQDEGIADENHNQGQQGREGENGEHDEFAGSGMNAEQRCETDFLLAEGEPCTAEVVAKPLPYSAAGVVNDDAVQPRSLVDDDLGEGEPDSGKINGVELQHSTWDRKQDDELEDFPCAPAVAGQSGAHTRPGDDDEREPHPESIAGVEDRTVGNIHEPRSQIIENEFGVALIWWWWGDGHGLGVSEQ